MSRRKVVWLSHGGGLDSMAMLLDAIDRDEQLDGVIFADVADAEHLDPGEWPSTYRYMREHVQEICELAGIEFVWLNAGARGERSLFAYFERTTSMPGRMTRLCTVAAKVEPITGYLEGRYPADVDLEVWIGFEAGEEARAARDPHAKGRAKTRRTNRFPLIEQAMCRCRCEAKVREWNLPVPRKSACVFCPFSSRGDFQQLRDQQPETFARVEALEEDCKLTKRGKTMRYGYKRGDGSDPTLRQWVLPMYKRRAMGCSVCGAPQRATKATGCDYLQPSEYVSHVELEVAS